MSVKKQHKGKTLRPERAEHSLSSASTHSPLGPSTGQMQLAKGTQKQFLPAAGKIKSKAGKQRDWIGFLRNLQKQHFILNRILMIMTSNVMLVPTESTRAIRLKHEKRRHTGPQEIPWDFPLMVSFPPLRASVVMGYSNGPELSQSQTVLSPEERYLRTTSRLLH